MDWLYSDREDKMTDCAGKEGINGLTVVLRQRGLMDCFY